MRAAATVLAVLVFSAQDPPAPAVHEETVRAVVTEIDRLKGFLVVVGDRNPDLLASLRKERPDLARLVADAELRVKEIAPVVKRNVKALSADDLETRTMAGENLAALGTVAIPYLRELLNAENVDLRAQAKELIDRIQVAGRAKGDAGPIRLELYDVTDLPKGKIDLGEAVRAIAGGDDAKEVIQGQSGLLIVRARPTVHARVHHLLTLLREIAAR